MAAAPHGRRLANLRGRGQLIAEVVSPRRTACASVKYRLSCKLLRMRDVAILLDHVAVIAFGAFCRGAPQAVTT